MFREAPENFIFEQELFVFGLDNYNCLCIGVASKQLDSQDTLYLYLYSLLCLNMQAMYSWDY